MVGVPLMPELVLFLEVAVAGVASTPVLHGLEVVHLFLVEVAAVASAPAPPRQHR